jgi:streptogramin lyase
MADTAGEQAEPTAWIVNVAACPEALAAHDAATDRAINVVGWAVDNGGGLHALAVSPDGTVRLISHERIVFDHAVRPTDY